MLFSAPKSALKTWPKVFPRAEKSKETKAVGITEYIPSSGFGLYIPISSHRIFIVLSVTNVREAIFNAIPMTLKSAVSAGIGLFIAFIGLQNAKIVVNNDSTLVSYQNFKTDFSSVGMGALLALIGVLITGYLLIKKVKGGILFGILITWVLVP